MQGCHPSGRQCWHIPPWLCQHCNLGWCQWPPSKTWAQPCWRCNVDWRPRSLPPSAHDPLGAHDNGQCLFLTMAMARARCGLHLCGRLDGHCTFLPEHATTPVPTMAHDTPTHSPDLGHHLLQLCVSPNLSRLLIPGQKALQFISLLSRASYTVTMEMHRLAPETEPAVR